MKSTSIKNFMDKTEVTKMDRFKKIANSRTKSQRKIQNNNSSKLFGVLHTLNNKAIIGGIVKRNLNKDNKKCLGVGDFVAGLLT